MSGSLLGRGRGGRLAVLGVCGAMVLLLVFLYRAATSEMARLRELHEQCAHQQEALAAQLQVIFEYKVRLEKSLAEEKSSNVAVKQELQQRASREKSLHDKDSIEATQRFNSLQQTYKLLQTEHQDLKEECKKHEMQALEETNRLETTLQDLRGRLRQAQEDKEKSMQDLKIKYMDLKIDKEQLAKKYDELLKSTGNDESTILHLKKQVFQLQRELELSKDQAKNLQAKSTSAGPVLVSPRASAPQSALMKEDSQPIPAPQQQQQVSPPLPLHAPRSHRADGETAVSEEKILNDDANEIRFIQKNGNIVPAGPNDAKEMVGEVSTNGFQKKLQKDVIERPKFENIQVLRPSLENVILVGEEKNRLDEEQRKQVMSPPLNRDDDGPKNDNVWAVSGSQAEQPLAQPAVERVSTTASSRPIADKVHAENDELQALQERVDGILNHNIVNRTIRSQT